MNTAMKKAKCSKKFFETLKEATTAATIIEKTTLHDECITALNAFKELNPHTHKRKRKEGNKSSTHDDSSDDDDDDK